MRLSPRVIYLDSTFRPRNRMRFRQRPMLYWLARLRRWWRRANYL
jgi:hypothetical protein